MRHDSDTECNKLCEQTDTLLRCVYVWLMAPVFIFIAGWLQWYVACSLFVLFALGGNPTSCRQYIKMNTGKLFSRQSLFVLLLCMMWLWLSGWGPWVNQHPDHIVRNACLYELILSPWPVILPDQNYLLYNIGFWLIPALAGKLGGILCAQITVTIWGGIGLWLVWHGLCLCARRYSYWFLVVLFLFGSLLNIQVWFGADYLRLHYFGIAEHIMCSVHASLPPLLFFVFLCSGKLSPRLMPVLFAAIVFYCPLAAFVGFPPLMCQWWVQSRHIGPLKCVIAGMLCYPPCWAAVLFSVCCVLYYQGVSAPGLGISVRAFYNHPNDWVLILSSFLIYGICCIRFFYKVPLFIAALVLGMILPFFCVQADANDLLAKGSIVPMACVAAFLCTVWERLRLWRWLVLCALIIGLAPRFNIPYYYNAFTRHEIPCSYRSFWHYEWYLLRHAPLAIRQHAWGQTMYHPGHRWYPYYTGKLSPVVRYLFK